MNSSEAREGAKAASNAGAMAEKVTTATDSSNSVLGRVGATAAAVRLATRLVPATWRLVKRYPGVSSMLLVAVVGVAFMARPTGVTRH
jgi:hypothetical protein